MWNIVCLFFFCNSGILLSFLCHFWTKKYVTTKYLAIELALWKALWLKGGGIISSAGEIVSVLISSSWSWRCDASSPMPTSSFRAGHIIRTLKKKMREISSVQYSLHHKSKKERYSSGKSTCWLGKHSAWSVRSYWKINARRRSEGFNVINSCSSNMWRPLLS